MAFHCRRAAFTVSPNHCGSKLIHVTDHLTEKEDKCVDVWLVDQCPEKICVEIRVVEQLPRGVDRIGHSGEWDPLLEVGPGRHRASVGTSSPDATQASAIMTAAPPDKLMIPTRLARRKDSEVDELRNVEHLIDGIHGDESVLPKNGLVGIVGAHDRPGMGLGCPRPDVAFADLDNHDRTILFQGGFGGVYECIAVANLFNVRQRGTRFRITHDVFEHLRQLNVRLVAGGGEKAQTEIQVRWPGPGYKRRTCRFAIPGRSIRRDACAPIRR